MIVNKELSKFNSNEEAEKSYGRSQRVLIAEKRQLI